MAVVHFAGTGVGASMELVDCLLMTMTLAFGNFLLLQNQTWFFSLSTQTFQAVN